ncbi:plastocyanin/azurin family copper-binding protein [Paenibacillus sp. MBLB4367]|uniref:plastocyanin/azurin family copper-binding protein n=1 Tax=Paenibacillus sp. MBLB4367 TaxID=3384767 RepID=UPI003907F871
MKKRNRKAVWLLASTLMLGSAVPAWAADAQTGTTAAPAAANVKTDVQIVTELGVLQGEGSGVTDSYLAKPTTRLQAAILFLRLKGLEKAALDYKGTDNFTDASAVNEANQAILAYLKANPQLGWTGTGGGKFEPAGPITDQQYYKVLLEALGQKQDTDFTYGDVLAFAKSQGLSQIAGAGALRNRHIASATVEALKTKVKGGAKTLIDALVEQKVVDAGKASSAGYASIRLAHDMKLGAYLTDEAGKTLYYFTKDTANTSVCADQCAANWPVYYAENIQIPSELSASDFLTIVRADGKKQTTYKGMPLYYFVKDTKAGDVNGQGVNNVWYVVNHAAVSVSTKDGLGKFLVDSTGKTLYLFTKDSKDMSVCKGTCEANWPIFYSAHIADTADLKAADFGTITREDGTKQTTYKGMPLYYFVKDMKAGDATGQGVNNVWYVIDPSAKQSAPQQPAAKTYAIEMADFAFSQATLTVEAGSTITFTNKDKFEHNAVSDALTADGKPVFATKLLATGESATITLDKPGEYTYYCEPHKGFMKATIIVK